MVRSLLIVVCVCVLDACIINTKVGDKNFVCGTNDDCVSGFVCYERLCITREEFFNRDSGTAGGSAGGGSGTAGGGGSGTAGGMGGAAGGCTIECPAFDGGPDSGEPDSGTMQDGGTPDSGTVPDSGAPDSGTVPDSGTPDAGCDAGTGVEICGDGIDNNCNTQVDCAELSCAMMGCGTNGRVCTGLMCVCGGGGTPEASELTCNDMRDNDCDGQFDCADSTCSGRTCGANGRTCSGTSCTCGGNGGTAQTNESLCADTRDNDCDGLTDCADSQCAGQTCGANGRSCSGTTCACSGNGGTAQTNESLCSDTRDNDCDGLTDCADSQCAGQTCGANGRSCSGTSCACSGNGGTAQTNESLCSDARDNDCDGLVDCADSQCAGLGCGANGRTCSGTSCTCSGNGGAAQATETSCSDGFDNDCDGLIDAMDPSCMTAPLDGGYTVTTPSPQTFVDACSQTGSTRFMFMDPDDDTTPLQTMPFVFQFYGIPVTQYWIGTNGIIGFGSRDSIPAGNCLPGNSLSPRPAIYVDHDDLIATNGVCMAVTGSAPNRKLVITWPSMDAYNYPGTNFTFSAFITETTQTIDFVYSTMSGTTNARGADAVIGMQNADGSRYNEVICRVQGYLMTGASIRFTRN